MGVKIKVCVHRKSHKWRDNAQLGLFEALFISDNYQLHVEFTGPGWRATGKPHLQTRVPAETRNAFVTHIRTKGHINAWQTQTQSWFGGYMATQPMRERLSTALAIYKWQRDWWQSSQLNVTPQSPEIRILGPRSFRWKPAFRSRTPRCHA